MSNPDTHNPAPWSPDEIGAFIVQLGTGGEPHALHTFSRRRGTDPSTMWHVADVCDLRGVDPCASPCGSIEPDGRFMFFHLGGLADSSKARLIAFVEAADPRLHFEEFDPSDVTSWTFE